MSIRNKAQNRLVRIELLRARAALERQSLRRQSLSLGSQLQPGRLFSSVVPSFNTRSVGSLLGSAFSLGRRYPFLLSGASTVLSAFGGRWVKLAAAGLVGWKLLGAYRDSKPQERHTGLIPVHRNQENNY